MRRFYIILATLIAVLVSCGKADPPKVAPNREARATVVCIGGAGTDLTVNLADAIREKCPGVEVLQVAKKDAHDVDVPRWLDEQPPSRNLVVISHSWGSNRETAVAKSHKIKLGVYLDPVSYAAGGTQEVSSNAETVYVFFAEHSTFFRAKVVGPTVQPLLTIRNTDHGSICFSPEVRDFIIEKINEIK